MVQISEYGEHPTFSTTCIPCGRPIGLCRNEDGDPMYMDDIGRTLCPDPEQNDELFVHEPANHVFVHELA
jgi:hypothetical protein